MQTIREVMTSDVVTVAADASVSEIAALMSARGISGVPVMEGEQVIGMVTELDLVARNARFKLPAFITLLNATIYLETPGHVEKRLQHMLGTTAREVMSPVVTISANGTLEELAELMVDRRVNPIPVVESGRLVGIVSRADVVRLMAQQELRPDPV
jgi:CBS domain-containing protein